MNFSCGSKPTDLRTLIPADSLIYLESNDLGAVMQTITERPAFREAAKTVPDFSVLNGVKLAVAVTGFETKEQPVTDDAAVLNFQPRFVAILETNAWDYQALAFTEQKLGEFINKVYGGEVLLETSDKHNGKYFVWKANDGRKAFALVQGSVIFFGNDETAIDKSLAVKRGEADSIAKNPKITTGDRLAFGYVSPDGVAEIVNVVAVKYASEASDQPEVQSFLARILPQLLRSSVTEISWIASKSEEGIEDRYLISLQPDIARIFSETMSPLDSVDEQLLKFAPANADSVTQYSIKNPQVAWRSILLAAQKVTDPLAGKLVVVYANSLFEPFGIKDGEGFLSAVGPGMLTVKFGEGDSVAAISKTLDPEKTDSSFDPDFNQTIGSSFDSSGPGFEGVLVHGDPDVVLKCSQAQQNGSNLSQDLRFRETSRSLPTARTRGLDHFFAAEIAEIVSEKKSAEIKVDSIYIAETRFNNNGVERKTTSDFGFFGWIITQFGKDQ